MEKPKCRVCGERHWSSEPHRLVGVKHVATLPPGTKTVPVAGVGILAVHPEHPPKLVTASGVEEIKPVFDRKSYQREYMRKRRAKAKEGK